MLGCRYHGRWVGDVEIDRGASKLQSIRPRFDAEGGRSGNVFENGVNNNNDLRLGQ